MFNKAPKAVLLSVAAFAVALMAQAAGAATITDWTYTINSGFTDYTSTNGDQTGITPTQVGPSYNNAPTKLAWGVTDPDGPSSISIDGQVTGAVQTGAPPPWQPGATFTHDNNVIDASFATLDTFELTTELLLDAVLPPSEAGDTGSVGPLTFDGFFFETLNSASPCPSGGSNPCSDIFVLTNASALPGQSAGGSFVIAQDFTTTNGGLYTALLSIDGLGLLGSSVCTSAGAASNCVGFTTLENQATPFNTQIAIVARGVPVPAPGSLAILAVGFGLIGLGFATRRRNGLQG